MVHLSCSIVVVYMLSRETNYKEILLDFKLAFFYSKNTRKYLLIPLNTNKIHTIN